MKPFIYALVDPLSTCGMSPALAAHLLLTAKRNVRARQLSAADIDPTCLCSVCEDCGGAAHKGVLCAVFRGAANRDTTPLHKAADAGYRQMLLIVMAAFLRGRKALGGRNVDAAVAAIKSSLISTLPTILLKTYVAGGEVGISSLRKMLRVAQDGTDLRTLKPKIKPIGPFKLKFNVKSPTAIKWAKTHAAELAKDLSKTSEDRIKRAIAAALEGDGIESAKDAILDAVGDRARADMIARTEVMTAANEGQRESWEQAVEAGFLSPNSRVAWIATEPGACPECEAMDGSERSLDDADYDGTQPPPLHPNCRCTEGITG